ncbi:MAG: hypothetical protein V4735_07425 [Pseudomonadota bacterium]
MKNGLIIPKQENAESRIQAMLYAVFEPTNLFRKSDGCHEGDTGPFDIKVKIEPATAESIGKHTSRVAAEPSDNKVITIDFENCPRLKDHVEAIAEAVGNALVPDNAFIPGMYASKNPPTVVGSHQIQLTCDPRALEKLSVPVVWEHLVPSLSRRITGPDFGDHGVSRHGSAPQIVEFLQDELDKPATKKALLEVREKFFAESVQTRAAQAAGGVGRP